MPNTILTIDDITKTAAWEFYDALKFVKSINRSLDGSFGQVGAKRGSTIRVRLPNDFTVVKNNLDITSSIEAYVERNATLQLTDTATVPLEFTTQDLTLSMDRFNERIIRPAARRLAIQVEEDAIAFAVKNTAKAVGTWGTTPTSAKTFDQARAKISEARCPPMDNYCLITPNTRVELGDSLRGLFAPQGAIGQQYKTGMVTDLFGLDWYESICYYTHTHGTFAGTPLTNGSNQGITTGWASYTDLITDGWTSGQLAAKVGDVLTIQDVYATKPGSSTSLGYLRQFVVVSDIADTTGSATIRISPAIIAGGPYQNCTARAGDGKTVAFAGTTGVVSQQNLVYNRDAFMFGTADLNIEGAVEASRFSDAEAGISVAIIRQMDPKTRTLITRLDTIYGFSAPSSGFSCRVVS